jgi:hypothetical protein
MATVCYAKWLVTLGVPGIPGEPIQSVAKRRPFAHKDRQFCGDVSDSVAVVILRDSVSRTAELFRTLFCSPTYDTRTVVTIPMH